MTLRELFEHAQLEALGLLEPAEQEAFDRAFAGASPAIQAQIRDEQARLVSSDALLPEVSPRPELRDKVIGAVSAAMALAAANGSAQVAADVMEFRPSRRVAPWWRTAAVGLVTACAILSAAFVNVYSSNQQLQDRLTADRDTDELTRATASSRQLLDLIHSPETRRVVFTLGPDAVAGFSGQATLFTHPQWDKSKLYFSGLPTSGAGETYRLVVLTAANEVRETIARFSSTQTLQSISLDKLEAGTRLAIVSDRTGNAGGSPQALLLVATV